ncbi:hypothetical protein CH1034_250047 [Klebsiella pneumoniae]|nr:hypothetical protein CH1034_250047 [Klebsiella pneumoniae]
MTSRNGIRSVYEIAFVHLWVNFKSLSFKIDKTYFFWNGI